MKKTIFSLLFVTVLLPFTAFAEDLAGYYKSEKPPSSKIVLRNLKILQGPSSVGIGRQGKIQTILGLHKQINTQTFILYYCYDTPRKNWVFGNSRTDECFNDIVLIPLNSGIWIMQSIVSNEWILVTDQTF